MGTSKLTLEQLEAAVDHADSVVTSLVVFGTASLSQTPTDRFLNPGNDGSSATTSRINYVIPRTGVLKNMYFTNDGPNGNGNDVVYTVEKNAILTALSLTVPSTTAAANNTVNTVSVVAGDLISIRVTKASSITNSIGPLQITMELFLQ